MRADVLREIWLALDSGNADIDAINNAVSTAYKMKDQQIALTEFWIPAFTTFSAVQPVAFAIP